MCGCVRVCFSVFSALNFGPLFPQVKCILGLIIIADYFFFALVCSFEEIVKTFVFLCVDVVAVAITASGSFFVNVEFIC